MSPCPDCDGPGRAELERSAKELAAAGCVLAADLEEWLVVLAGRAPADSRESLKGWWDAFTRFAPVTPAENPYRDHLFVRGLSQAATSVAEGAWDEGFAAGLVSLSPHGRDEADAREVELAAGVLVSYRPCDTAGCFPSVPCDGCRSLAAAMLKRSAAAAFDARGSSEPR